MADTESYQLFTEYQAMPYVELKEVDAAVLKGILRGQVIRQALANVLKLARAEEDSLKGMNFLTDPSAIETSLRKQGQMTGLVLAIETLIAQAFAYEDEEIENGEEDPE